MAIQYVGGRGAGRAGSTSTVNVAINSGLSGGIGSAAIAGDLVIVSICVGSQARNPSCAVSGYTALTQQNVTATTYDTSFRVSYKFMPATPDTTVTIPSTGNIADGQGYAIHVFRGVDSTVPLDGVTPTYATGSGTNNRPDPAAITPASAGAWIYFGGGGAASTGTTVFTASYLSGFLSYNGPDTNDGTVGAGYYSGWSSGSYDGAAWSGGSANAANSWAATTLALRPGAVNYSLTATGITATPALATPALAQNHTLVAPSGLATTPGLGGPLLSQAHSLTATGIAGGSPTTGTPAITVFENYSLTANGIAGGPATGTPTISQVHALTGDGQTVAPETGSPAVSQNQVLVGDGVTAGAPALGGPAVSQAHLLTANTMAMGAPDLSEPLVAQLHQMIAEDLETGTPALGTPTIGGASHELTADGLTFGAELDETTLSQIHALVVNGIIAGPETGEPGILQIHSLLAHEITGDVILSESYIVVPPPPGPSRTFIRQRRSMVRQTRTAVTRNKLRMVR